MSLTAEDVFGVTHPKLLKLVRAKRAVCGSMMVAYRLLAPEIGASVPWIRKVLGRAKGATIHAHQYLNIKAQYDALCARVEDQAALERLQALRLEELNNALIQRALDPVQVASTPQPRPEVFSSQSRGSSAAPQKVHP